MIPDGVLSTEPVPSRFFGARALAITKTIDFEDGGFAIQNPSLGLLYQRWRARLFDEGTPYSYILLDAPLVPDFVAFSGPNISEFSFTFDQNMQTVFAYVQNGISYLRWYDSTISGFTITEIGAGVVTPRVSYDDKRSLATNGYQTSDVICAYVRDGNLYYRQQRDRYTIERLLKEGVTPLIKIGMSRGLRLQFMHEVAT